MEPGAGAGNRRRPPTTPARRTACTAASRPSWKCCDERSEPERITLAEWDRALRRAARAAGLREPDYGGPLRRHVDDGDLRLLKLRMDNSAAALRLWNFLLSEEDRLRASVAEGKKLVGTMKDLGTVPVMAYSLDNLVAFYPDGAWWLPCVLENGRRAAGDRRLAGHRRFVLPGPGDARARSSSQNHFPLPGLLTCSVGATCDDFSAIAQRLESLGFPILWWEIPHRRRPDAGEAAVELPGGFRAPAAQVAFVKSELRARARRRWRRMPASRSTDERLSAGHRPGQPGAPLSGRTAATWLHAPIRAPCRRWRC